MGIPGRTYFCHNGHIVYSFGHHEWGEDMDDDWSPKCEICGSTNIQCHTEWGDKDYEQLVPTTPLGGTRSKCNCCNGLGYNVEKYYDVSKLF